MTIAAEKYVKLTTLVATIFQWSQVHLADYFANAAKKVTPTAACTFAKSSSKLADGTILSTFYNDRQI